MKGEYDNWMMTSDGKINWSEMGFLSGFDGEKRMALAKALNKLYDYLLKVPDESLTARKLKEHGKLTCLFPTLRRIVERCPIEKAVLKNPKKFVAFFLDYWDEYYASFKSRGQDTEAIICVAFADIIIKTIMDSND